MGLFKIVKLVKAQIKSLLFIIILAKLNLNQHNFLLLNAQNVYLECILIQRQYPANHAKRNFRIAINVINMDKPALDVMKVISYSHYKMEYSLVPNVKILCKIVRPARVLLNASLATQVTS